MRTLAPTCRKHQETTLACTWVVVYRGVAVGEYLRVWEQSLSDPQEFWADAARGIEWFRQPQVILDDSHAPHYRWFVGGELNTCFNAVDRHVNAGRGDQTALICDSPVTGVKENFTFDELL